MEENKHNYKENLHADANFRVFQFAEQNRKNETEAESLLWSHLKKSQLGGYKFRRQHPIGKYILDFYCHKTKLAIEIDGAYHFSIEQQNHDKARTEELKRFKIQEIRFKNEDVFADIWGVLEAIWGKCNEIEAQKSNK